MLSFPPKLSNDVISIVFGVGLPMLSISLLWGCLFMMIVWVRLFIRVDGGVLCGGRGMFGNAMGGFRRRRVRALWVVFIVFCFRGRSGDASESS